MARGPVLTITMTGDAKGATAAATQVEASYEGMGAKMTGVVAGVTAAVTSFAIDAGKQLLSNVGDWIELGRQAEIFQAKADTVFGESASSVREFAAESAGAMGLTADAAVGLAANMGDLLVPIGFTRSEAAELSTDSLDVAAALSAWSGGTIDTKTASEDLAKAMLGEREGLKKYGVSINQAEVDQRALKIAQDDGRRSIEARDRALATSQLITEKATDSITAWNDGTMDAVKAQNQQKATWSELATTVGTALLPAAEKLGATLVELAPQIEKVVAELLPLLDVVVNLAEGIGWAISQIADGDIDEVLDYMGQLKTDAGFAADEADRLGMSSQQVAADLLAMGASGDHIRAVLAEMAGTESELIGIHAEHSAGLRQLHDDTRAAEQAARDAAREQMGYGEAQGIVEDSIRDARTAQERQNEAMRSARDLAHDLADAVLDLADADDDLHDAVERATETMGDQEASARDQDRAIRGVIRSADRYADTFVKQQGVDRDTLRGQQLWNQAMVDNAAELEGPMRDAILGYIADVNSVPDEQMTEIEALIDAGKLTEARQALDNVAAGRTATVGATPDHDSLAHTDRELDRIANKTRRAVIGAAPSQGAMAPRANGGRAAAGTPYWVGERGPEPFIPGADGYVMARDKLANLRSRRGGGGSSITINMPAGTRPTDVADALRRYEKRNGPR